ncbi:MAG: SIMPL domain-containing protein [Dehalococcoidia bacterium]
MNGKLFGPIALAVAGVALVAVACGGGDRQDPDEAAIRIDNGLSVAALAPQGGFGGEQAIGLGGGAPAAEIAFARGGDIGFASFSVTAQQLGQTGITVQGFGSATVDADSAILEFSFGTDTFYPIRPVPAPLPPDEVSTTVDGESIPIVDEPLAPDEVQPITEDALRPVIDAIVALGVDRDDIEFVGSPYYDPYFSSATLRATVSDLDALDGIVDAATAAAANLADIGFHGSSISYAVSDCTALEKAAIEAAVEDVGERGALFADALGVGLGPVLGASHYTYSYFGPSPCDPTTIAYPEYYGGYYDPSRPAEVQLISNVIITYAIQ